MKTSKKLKSDKDSAVVLLGENCEAYDEKMKKVKPKVALFPLASSK